MSVINQMLKDLDKRQGEQTASSNVVIPTTTKNSSIKILTIIIIAIILVNIVGIFVWQLYSENQSLKTQAQQSNTKISQINSASSTVEDNALANTQPTNNQAEDSQLESTQVDKTLVKNETKKVTPGKKLVNAIESALSTSAAASKQARQVKVNNEQAVTTQTEIEPLPSEVTISKTVEPRETSTVNKIRERKPTLTISRSQLSPKALAGKKITEAERAMEINNVAKAESLFEEVLLLLPEHETARKQLAALWYGKKAYQDAVNLLSQGIAISPQNEEMRLMSARIYFEQGQAKQALNVLTPINNSQSVEVQVLIANIAAELNEHKNAARAYRKLLAIEPNIGRWWLGLAVSLDSQGQFSLARNAYNQAILQANLSSNALQFARQRVSELGE